MSAVDEPTRALVRLAAAIAGGRADRVRGRAEEAVAGGMPPLWGDELLLQSVLMAGYPRALAAAQIWRDVVGIGPRELEDGADGSRYGSWRERGEATCRVVYGANYAKLRENVARLHPALDAWMVIEGYGRTLSRPGLDLARREFAVVAQVLVLGAERQLHSHLRGARNAGATDAAIEQVIEDAATEAAPADMAMGLALWSRIR